MVSYAFPPEFLTPLPSVNHLNHQLSLEPLTQDRDPQLTLLPIYPPPGWLLQTESRRLGDPAALKSLWFSVLEPRKAAFFFPVSSSLVLPVLGSPGFPEKRPAL